ncbi:MAG TPA: ABC transporter ATP-binding protein [Candidatus Sulfomarinibacteraceae bacterium]|nr:ABC transporter ATP-binding protein [Candidatus Sulfomarinibacteraceae bacterium]
MNGVKPLSIPRGTWALIRYRPGFFLLSLLGSTAYITTQLVPGWVEKIFFDQLTGAADITRPLAGILALLVVVELARSLVDIVAHWAEAHVRNAGGSLMRANVVRNVLQKPGAEPLPVPVGDAINRLDDDVADFADFPTWIPYLTGTFTFTLLAVYVLFTIAPLITAVALLPLAGVLLLNRFAFRRFLRYNHRARQAASGVTAFLGETLGAVQAIKVAGAAGGVLAHFRQLNETRREASVRNAVFFALFNSATQNMGDVAVAVMVLLAGFRISQGTFSVGDFALFSAYLFYVAQFPAHIGSYLSEIAQERVVLERTQELQPHAPPESLVARRPLRLSQPLSAPRPQPGDELQRLQVRGLTCRYEGKSGPEGAPGGVEDVTFTLEAGSFTVITGPVGAGKTTLLRALLGLLPRQAGQILWNGRLIEDPAAWFVPPRAAYVPQTPRLFSDPLRHNILMGLPQDEVDLDAAIKAAVLVPDVARLEAGLETLVGPRGVRLSGGQVQRAAAARALVRRPSLLVLDDISSALDVETEQQLWRNLLTPGDDGRRPTLLVVAHRPETLRRADQVLTLY